MANRLQELARKNPGLLLQKGLAMMKRYMDPLRGGGGAGHSKDAKELPPIVTLYLTTVLQVIRNRSGSSLGLRNEREMRTLAEAIDDLLQGQVVQAADKLMQRFKALELASSEGGDWGVARHLELIPPGQVASVGNVEKSMAANLEAKEQKLALMLKKHGDAS